MRRATAGRHLDRLDARAALLDARAGKAAKLTDCRTPEDYQLYRHAQAEAIAALTGASLFSTQVRSELVWSSDGTAIYRRFPQ